MDITYTRNPFERNEFGILDRSVDEMTISSSTTDHRDKTDYRSNGKLDAAFDGQAVSSTPVKPDSADSATPDESGLDSISEKDCPTEFTVDESMCIDDSQRINVPIVGYEIMEERARFTVFKLHVQKNTTENWFVFRRYTDFIWLNDQLRTMFPVFRLNLPPKRWFGDNFEDKFLSDRQNGLQAFINNIMGHREVSVSKPVHDFLCLDDPPGPHESLEESRALCECLEETMYRLRREVAEKDTKILELEDLISMYKARVDSLEKVLKLERSFNPDSPQNETKSTKSAPSSTSSHSKLTAGANKTKVKPDDNEEETSVVIVGGALTDDDYRNMEKRDRSLAVTSCDVAHGNARTGSQGDESDSHSNEKLVDVLVHSEGDNTESSSAGLGTLEECA